MYSKLPVPHVEWDKKSLSWALCWFPLIGGVIGGGLLLWFWLSA
ncbi:MAG: adenosylcobinamide-GDP ribazoletransferase, partial [Oscillospiraceae bacterium]